MAPQSQSLGWIWPKDPRPGNPSTWPRHWRFLDVFTNKGPDIYVGKISNKPSKSRSRSRSSSPKSSTTGSSDSRSSSSCSFYTSESEPIPPKSPRKTNWDRWGTRSDTPAKKSQTQVPWAKRKSNERYDFRQRKYAVPDLGTWSRVEYCTLRGKGGWIRLGKKEKHCVPRRYWDQNGKEYPANYWHDIIYGEHDDEIQE